MLEYSLDDAQALLEKNLSMANNSLNQLEEDLSFLRDQITTLEVSILCHENHENGPVISIYFFFCVCVLFRCWFNSMKP